MVTKLHKKIRLDQNDRSWVMDRVENNEPLYYKEFTQFAATNPKFGTKAHKERLREEYKKYKALVKKAEDINLMRPMPIRHKARKRY